MGEEGEGEREGEGEEGSFKRVGVPEAESWDSKARQANFGGRHPNTRSGAGSAAGCSVFALFSTSFFFCSQTCLVSGRTVCPDLRDRERTTSVPPCGAPQAAQGGGTSILTPL